MNLFSGRKSKTDSVDGDLAKSLYAKNAELGIKNKTLSLLSKLYEISILSLEPEELAVQISDTVRTDLSFELVSILLSKTEGKELSVLSFSTSERLTQTTSFTLSSLSSLTISLNDAALFSRIMKNRSFKTTQNPSKVWGSVIPDDVLAKMKKEGHLEETIIFPLVARNRVIGLLVFGLNRTYEELVDHEKNAIQNFINVIAVALDKEILGEELKNANERLKELDKLKSEFVSIASHQLRSPLTAIRGYASLLEEGSFGKLPVKATEAVRRISESARYMALSVEDYLNVSRIEAGNMKYEMANVDIKELVKNTVNELQPTAIKRGLLLTSRSKLIGKSSVYADPGKTKQIIQNLIDNSMKYTPKGTIDVVLRGEGNKALIDITDTGIGMSEETIHKVFEKFERAHNANDVNVTGTGLGLYIARKMANEMQGNVSATSPGEGKGSTFTIELPLSKN